MPNAYSIASPLKLDVVIPTYNRADLLRKAIASLLRAERPDFVELNIYAVDNNSKDNTKEVIKSFGGIVHYVFEANQGRSHALNAGISAGTGDVIGFIDDDEEIREDWLRVTAEWLAKPDVDFIGGPYLGEASFIVPKWFPPSFSGIYGIMKQLRTHEQFANDGGPMLMGGNAVIRRSLLVSLGGYNTHLGRTHKKLLSCEDDEIFLRLLDCGARGFHVPDLVIYHFIPTQRLTKAYCRSWCFWRGVSETALATLRPCGSPKLLGVPRWVYGKCFRAALRAIVGLHRQWYFDAELQLWNTSGRIYGAHLIRRNANRRSIAVHEAEPVR